MGAVVARSFLFFAAGFLLAFAAAFLILGLGRKSAGAPDESLWVNAATAAYLLLVTAVPPAGGFGLVTSPFAAWRSLSPALVAGISAAAGAVTDLVGSTGLAGFLLWIPLPFGSGPIGIALRLMIPGAALGLIAVAAARFLTTARDS